MRKVCCNLVLHLHHPASAAKFPFESPGEVIVYHRLAPQWVHTHTARPIVNDKTNDHKYQRVTRGLKVSTLYICILNVFVFAHRPLV